jgi:hypothetical protein
MVQQTGAESEMLEDIARKAAGEEDLMRFRFGLDSGKKLAQIKNSYVHMSMVEQGTDATIKSTPSWLQCTGYPLAIASPSPEVKVNCSRLQVRNAPNFTQE